MLLLLLQAKSMMLVGPFKALKSKPRLWRRRILQQQQVLEDLQNKASQNIISLHQSFAIETRESGSLGYGQFWRASLQLLYSCWEIQVCLQMQITSGGETFLTSCISISVQLRLVYRKFFLCSLHRFLYLSVQTLSLASGV